MTGVMEEEEEKWCTTRTHSELRPNVTNVAPRRELERHCQQVAREAPHGEGPLINPIDAASAKGEILD